MSPKERLKFNESEWRTQLSHLYEKLIGLFIRMNEMSPTVDSVIYYTRKLSLKTGSKCFMKNDLNWWHLKGKWIFYLCCTSQIFFPLIFIISDTKGAISFWFFKTFQSSHLKCTSKFIAHQIIQYWIDARRHIIENSRYVGRVCEEAYNYLIIEISAIRHVNVHQSL